MRTLALAAAAALAACAPAPPWEYSTDSNRVPLPDVCRRDLAADTADVVVAFMPRSVLTKTVRDLRPGYTVSGTWDGWFIRIADDLDGWRLADVLHHERCHAVCSRTKAPSCTGHFAPQP